MLRKYHPSQPGASTFVVLSGRATRRCKHNYVRTAALRPIVCAAIVLASGSQTASARLHPAYNLPAVGAVIGTGMHTACLQ